MSTAPAAPEGTTQLRTASSTGISMTANIACESATRSPPPAATSTKVMTRPPEKRTNASRFSTSFQRLPAYARPTASQRAMGRCSVRRSPEALFGGKE